MRPDGQLLREYAEHQAEGAFTELVERHLDLVYSAALRQLNGDAHLAEDVAQMVFTDLARQAAALSARPSLSGWLYTSTHFAAGKIIRTQSRRRLREEEAETMRELHCPPETAPAWEELQPILDAAMHELKVEEREAVLLRYFERRPLAEVGTRLGVSENAARMRVERAVEKLRTIFARRGLAAGAVGLGAVLSAHAMQTAPGGLAGTVATAALAAPAGVATLFAAGKAKVLLATLAGVLGVAAWLLWSSRSPQAGTESARTSLSASSNQLVQAAGTNVSPAMPDTTASTLAVAAPTNVLHLEVLAADSDRPIPQATVHSTQWTNQFSDYAREKDQMVSRRGEADVVLVSNTFKLEVIVASEGFVDTRLLWDRRLQEVFPDHYVLRLPRAVPMGGRVLGADGQPLADARITFYPSGQGAMPKNPPEDHNFDTIRLSTGTDGRWQMQRLTADLLPYLAMSVRHPQHVEADLRHLEGTDGTGRAFLEETHVCRMERSFSLAGRVVDADGRPVAKAHLIYGERDSTTGRRAQTGLDGKFLLPQCAAGPEKIRVQAEGFLPKEETVMIRTNVTGLELVLERGEVESRTLRLRVVNRQGQPVVAKVSTYTHTASIGGMASSRAASFSRLTKADGRLVCTNLPNAEMELLIRAPHYMDGEVTLQPLEEEQTVTLAPALVVSGTIRSAQTGLLVSNVQMLCGFPDLDYQTKETNPNWSEHEDYIRHFYNGHYEHEFKGALISGIENPGYVLKFQAEGYAAYTSRVITPEEGRVKLDVRLQPDAVRRLTVLQPDGTPAAGASVGLLMPGAHLELFPGRINPEIQSYGTLFSTDKQGRFRWQPDAAVERIVLVHATGYAELLPSALTEDTVVPLQPWGRVEGTLLVEGQPMAGLRLLPVFPPAYATRMKFDYGRYVANTDAAGHFVIEKLPPGPLALYQTIRADPATVAPDQMRHFQEQGIVPFLQLTNLVLAPGSTVEVNFPAGLPMK